MDICEEYDEMKKMCEYTEKKQSSEYDEVIVNDEDQRQKIYESVDKDEDIIKCIGQIFVSYRYPNNGKWVKNKPLKYKVFKCEGTGTGTVFHVDSNNRAYVITCGHNVRLKIIECPKCHCYIRIPRHPNKFNHLCPNEQCHHGNDEHDTFNHIMIKPTSLVFRRRGTTENTFGDMVKAYDCSINEEPNQCYRKWPNPYVDDYYTFKTDASSGYDLAIITFKITDNYKYAQYSQNVLLCDKQKELKDQNTNFAMKLYGYPGDRSYRANKMYGMGSTKNCGYSVEANDNGKHYLKQQNIDTWEGQSGSAVWYQEVVYSSLWFEQKKTIIYAIHTGGNQGNAGKNVKPYNVATLFDAVDIMYIDDYVRHPRIPEIPFYQMIKAEEQEKRTGWEKRCKLLRQVTDKQDRLIAIAASCYDPWATATELLTYRTARILWEKYNNNNKHFVND